MGLVLDQDGAQLFPGLINESLLENLEGILSNRPRGAGVRIYGDPALSEWISIRSPVGQLARSLLGDEAQAVRAILFDKSPETNWALGWHQDRTIAVRERTEVEGFDNWTVKAGITHVEPPFGLLERMITARIHLDDVDDDNGPLLIAPGSHRLGRLEEHEIKAAVESHGTMTCHANSGDVWIYKTAILHASEASHCSTSRRVLQIDFSADDLPGDLEWAGIG
jgi:ectoine hydroxylase-related dioxygenase (phytanoyl-CoA dioxygenase family)